LDGDGNVGVVTLKETLRLFEGDELSMLGGTIEKVVPLFTDEFAEMVATVGVVKEIAS